MKLTKRQSRHILRAIAAGRISPCWWGVFTFTTP